MNEQVTMGAQRQECGQRSQHDRAPDGPVYLYALAEPDDPQAIRYIGKSKNPKRRLMHHLCPAVSLGRKRSAATLVKMAAAQQTRRSREREVALRALPADAPQTFGMCLRRARLSVGWSLRRLSAVVDIHRAILVAMEKGLHAPPTAQAMQRLAVALDIPLEQLEALAARAAAQEGAE